MTTQMSAGNLNTLQAEAKAEVEREVEKISRRVGAIFYDQPSAERAIRDLVEHGFPVQRIRTAVLRSADTGVAGLASLAEEGFAETDARKFEQGLRAGGMLITVDAGARLPDAVESLIRSGGYVGDGSMDNNTTPAMPANTKFHGA